MSRRRSDFQTVASRRVFNFELYDKGGWEVCGCLSARRAHDWLVYEVEQDAEEG